MKLIVKNIGVLAQVREKPVIKVAGNEMKGLPSIQNGFLFCENGKFHSWGSMDEFKTSATAFDSLSQASVVDAAGGMVLPTWCDSHTHLVFATPRENEFVDRIKGLTYEEIAKRGGGILNSAKKLAETSEETLTEKALERIHEVMNTGTGAIEIKSGYGLSIASELKMLRVIKKLKTLSPIPVKATFLGAHAIPAAYGEKRQEYIRLIIDEMLPVIAEEGLADYNDVFCDRGFFTPDETRQLLEAGWKYNLQPKIHANELDYSGGIQTGVQQKALSVDHLEFTGDDEIKALLGSDTMPTLLPSTAFFLRLPYAPARKMIEAGLPIALASDYNPGSSPSGNMPFVISLACIQMNMLPEESINAATINSAYAMGLEKTHGSISPGKTASFFITVPGSNPSLLPYYFGRNLIKRKFISGKEIR